MQENLQGVRKEEEHGEGDTLGLAQRAGPDSTICILHVHCPSGSLLLSIKAGAHADRQQKKYSNIQYRGGLTGPHIHHTPILHFTARLGFMGFNGTDLTMLTKAATVKGYNIISGIILLVPCWQTHTMAPAFLNTPTNLLFLQIKSLAKTKIRCICLKW